MKNMELISFDFKPHRFAPELNIAKLFFKNGYGVRVIRHKGKYTLACLIVTDDKGGYDVVPFSKSERCKENITLSECREITKNIKKLPPIKRKPIKRKPVRQEKSEKQKKAEKQYIKSDMYNLINNGMAQILRVRDVNVLMESKERIVVYSKVGKDLKLDYFCVITIHDFLSKYHYYKNKTEGCFGYDNYLQYLKSFKSQEYIESLKENRYIINSSGKLSDIYHDKAKDEFICEKTGNVVYFMLY